MILPLTATCLDPANDREEPVNEGLSLSGLEDCAAQIGGLWQAYKTTDDPLHLRVALLSLEEAVEAHNVSPAQLFFVIGGDLAEFKTPARFREFCLREAARQAQKYYFPYSDGFVHAQHIFGLLGLTLRFNYHEELARPHVTYPWDHPHRLKLLEQFGAAIGKPVTYHAANWTGGRDFHGFQTPAVYYSR